MSKKRRWLGYGAVLLMLLLVPVGIVGHRALQVTLGHTAKVMGSGALVSQRPADEVYEEDIAIHAPGESWKLDSAAGRLVVSAMGLVSRRAHYTEGIGVTVFAPGHKTYAFDAEFSPETIPPLDPSLPWPHGESEALASLDDKARQSLDAAVDWAYTDLDPEKPWQTRSVLVAQDGVLLAERYAPGFGIDLPMLGWSMTKSVTSALVGILVREGKLDIHAPAPVPEWSQPGDPRGAITTDMLLRMSSGLQFSESYLNPYGDALTMLYLEADMGGYAASRPLAHEPDTYWAYSSGTTNLVSRIIRQQVGSSQAAYFNFPRVALFNKIGVRSAIMEPDTSGTFVGSSYMYATARDWARFGQLYLQDGVWNGERIMPEGWVAYSTTPTPASPQGNYGAHWWLNVGIGQEHANQPMPKLPPDLYLASGHEGQFVVVVPSRRAVIVRLGMTAEGVFDLSGFLERILDALPE